MYEGLRDKPRINPSVWAGLEDLPSTSSAASASSTDGNAEGEHVVPVGGAAASHNRGMDSELNWSTGNIMNKFNMIISYYTIY